MEVTFSKQWIHFFSERCEQFCALQMYRAQKFDLTYGQLYLKITLHSMSIHVLGIKILNIAMQSL